MTAMLDGCFYWIGLIHVVAYTLLVASVVLIATLNAAYRRLRLGRIMLHMHWRYLAEKRAKKTGEPIARGDA